MNTLILAVNQALLNGCMDEIVQAFENAGATLGPKGATINEDTRISINPRRGENGDYGVAKLYMDSSHYILKLGKFSFTVVARIIGEKFYMAEDIEESYHGVVGPSMLVDEPEWPFSKKIAMLKSGFIPLLWCLPSQKNRRYFSDVICSEYTPFGSIFLNKNHQTVDYDDLCRHNLKDITINVANAASIVEKIERWKDMGGETFFKD